MPQGLSPAAGMSQPLVRGGACRTSTEAELQVPSNRPCRNLEVPVRDKDAPRRQSSTPLANPAWVLSAPTPCSPRRRSPSLASSTVVSCSPTSASRGTLTLTRTRALRTWSRRARAVPSSLAGRALATPISSRGPSWSAGRTAPGVLGPSILHTCIGGDDGRHRLAPQP